MAATVTSTTPISTTPTAAAPAPVHEVAPQPAFGLAMPSLGPVPGFNTGFAAAPQFEATGLAPFPQIGIPGGFLFVPAAETGSGSPKGQAASSPITRAAAFSPTKKSVSAFCWCVPK